MLRLTHSKGFLCTVKTGEAEFRLCYTQQEMIGDVPVELVDKHLNFVLRLNPVCLICKHGASNCRRVLCIDLIWRSGSMASIMLHSIPTCIIS